MTKSKIDSMSFEWIRGSLDSDPDNPPSNTKIKLYLGHALDL